MYANRRLRISGSARPRAGEKLRDGIHTCMIGVGCFAYICQAGKQGKTQRTITHVSTPLKRVFDRHSVI